MAKPVILLTVRIWLRLRAMIIPITCCNNYGPGIPLKASNEDFTITSLMTFALASQFHIYLLWYLLKRHFWKACLNFGKARCLWYAEKLFWFIAKILEFDIYRSSASNEDFLESWWRRKCSILNFPPLEYVSDFEPGSHADQWQWS